MASTSRCQSEIERARDVFISYCGPDVKHTLGTAICKALTMKAIRAFLDTEELQSEDDLPTAVKEAMDSAPLYVAIFSPGYAQSPRCLAELSFMLKSGKPIIPVFYRVQPSDLQYLAQGKGMYVNAFLEYQAKDRYNLEKLQEWKTAIHKASSLKGEIINDDKYDEQRVLKGIENDVLKILPKRKMIPLEVAKPPVGLEEVFADFEANIHPNIQIVGICGSSGYGKTTLAKKIFNEKHSSMEGSSFIVVKDNSKLHELQLQLLQNLGFNYQWIDNIEEGKMILANHFRSVRVLIILDNVDHKDQLDALLPAKSSLSWGSLIIVTTRNSEVLTGCGISSIYEMKKMNPTHAKQLFCWHAFLRPSPVLGFEELVEKFTSVCNWSPLLMKVFGSQLYGCSSKAVWDDLLQKISKISPDDIKNRLRVRYDALDEEDKQMFLDVACFPMGKDKVIATAVWEESGWSGLYGWERLVNMCLVDLDNNNHIIMNDHLRVLGREIANTQPPYRLWSSEQIMHIQKQEEVRGMAINATTNDICKFPTFLLNRSIGLFGLRRTRRPLPVGRKIGLCGLGRTRRPFPVGLKICVVRGNNLHIAKLSRQLAWLSYTESAHRILPSWLSLKNLRVLELHNSQKLEGLWKDGVEVPVQLRVLSITGCPKLRKIPESIGYLCNLKKIILGGSNHLRKVDTLPTAVEDIQVKDCKLLRNISGIGDVVNLQQLKLSNCPVLVELPSLHQLASLKVFELTGDNKVEKIQGLQQCTSLEKLVLNCKCWEVPGIESLEQLQRLRRLELVAKKRAAVEPCIQTIHKWPEEMIICTKAVADAGSHLNSSAFPNLSVHSFANKKISYLPSRFVTLLQKHSSNANAIMLCLVINCLSPRMEIVIKVDLYDAVFSTEVEEGKWILIGVFTQNSRCLTAQNFYIHQGRTESHQTGLISECDEVEKGFLVTGEELPMEEAFRGLLAFGR